MASASASAAAAAAAASSSSGVTSVHFRAPQPYMNEEDLTTYLGGSREAKVSVDAEFLEGIEDEEDRQLVTRVVSTIMAFFAGHVDPVSYMKQVTDTCINIKVTFPWQTVFDFAQMNAIQRLNEDRVRKIWVQGEEDKKTTSLVVSLFRASAARDVTVLDVILVQRTIREQNAETLEGEVDTSIGRNTAKRRRGPMPRLQQS